MFSYFLRLIWLRDGSFHTLGVWDCFLLLSASELSLVPGWRSAASPRLGHILHKETRIRRRSRVMGKYETARRLLNLFSGGPCDYCVPPVQLLGRGTQTWTWVWQPAMQCLRHLDSTQKKVWYIKIFLFWKNSLYTHDRGPEEPLARCQPTYALSKTNWIIDRYCLLLLYLSISVQRVGVEVACLISRMLFD